MGMIYFAALALLLLGIGSKLVVRDWLHPAVIFSLLWASNLGMTFLIAPEFLISASGPLWMLLSAFFVCSGSILGTWMGRTFDGRRAAQLPSDSFQPASNRQLMRFSLLCTCLGMLYVIADLRMQGIGLGKLLNLREFAKVAMQMSISRYSGKLETSKAEQVLLSFVYMVPILGGTLFVRRRSGRDLAVAIFSVLPSLASFAVSSTRSSILYGAVMWLSGYLTTRISLGKPLPTIGINRRMLLICLAAIPLLIGLIHAGDSLRTGGKTGKSRAQNVISGRVKGYLCGHVAALSIMIDSTNLKGEQAHLGENTVAGLMELLNPGSRKSGITAGVVQIPGSETNIFTYFWELILDFTAPGAIVVTFLLSFLAGFAYTRVKEHSLSWNGVLVAAYATMMFGIASLFNYNSMIFAFVLHGLICARPWKRRGEPAWLE